MGNGRWSISGKIYVGAHGIAGEGRGNLLHPVCFDRQTSDPEKIWQLFTAAPIIHGGRWNISPDHRLLRYIPCLLSRWFKQAGTFSTQDTDSHICHIFRGSHRRKLSPDQALL